MIEGGSALIEASLQNFSMTGWRYLDVKRTGTGACIVEVTNSPKTLSGEHKVKISTLMISTKVCPSPLVPND